MGWNNPEMPWSDLERRLSGRPPAVDPLAEADGGDGPAFSRRRPAYTPPPAAPPPDRTAGPPADPTGGPPAARGGAGCPPARVPYAELHAHSTFSFLDGASHPEELAEEAVRLGLSALAVTDHDGFYGVVRFAEAARALGMPTIFGAELSLRPPGVARLEPRAGSDKTAAADPHADHL
ncbi:MAG TPA: PHP domain-containing protein, partial [Pilimelia sp.]|nr:PHP domain-containing protein [Pilimelia sp.]